MQIKESQAVVASNNSHISHDGHRNNDNVGQGVGLGETPPIPRPPVSRTLRVDHNFTGGAGRGGGGAGSGAGSGAGGAGSGAGACLLASASGSSTATIERSSPRYKPLSSPESTSYYGSRKVSHPMYSAGPRGISRLLAGPGNSTSTLISPAPFSTSLWHGLLKYLS